jgi:hypothetical protein
VIVAGQLIAQALLTVTWKEQFALFSEESDTVQLTVVVPRGKSDPEGGLQEGDPTPVQLSETVGAA